MNAKMPLLLLLLLAGFALGCFSPAAAPPAPPSTFRIGYSDLAADDVFCQLRKTAFQERVQADPLLEVQYQNAAGSISRQLEQIDAFIAAGVSLVIIVPVDYKGVVPGIKKANAAGIPVITLGIQASGGDYTFIGSQNYDAGKLQGEYLRDRLPRNANLLYLKGTSGLHHSSERLQGFMDACLVKRLDVTVVATADADYRRAAATTITAAWLNTYPHIDAIVAANDQMALGALAALKAANRQSGVLISGIDGTQEACLAIKNGELAQSVYQNAAAQAQAAYQVVQNLRQGTKPPREVLVPFESITSDTVDNYLSK